jgi:uncharacterized protein DUF1990
VTTLADLAGRPLNFDPDAPHRPEDGWRFDHYCEWLPSEAPGEPVAGGPFTIAQELLRNYRVADPRLVRATYDQDAPLEQRDMLLELRFHGLRFHVGVRVGGTRDETSTVEGREVRIWGWNYRTLQGHLEMGQMDYEVWKWLDSGAVEFGIHAVSRAVAMRNPLVRLGFRLFGRGEQLRFARHACKRMAELVEAELTPKTSTPVPRVVDTVAVVAGTDPR